MKCKECGKKIETTFVHSESLKIMGLCNSCHRWGELCNRDRLLKDCVRINGKHYIVGPEDDTRRQWRGYGGSKFRIRKFDGGEIVTTNLWHQGDIPDHFRERLPDNAEFAR